MICYAVQRFYYSYLSLHLGRKYCDEGYIDKLDKIFSLDNIGKTIIKGKIKVKFFPEARYIEK